MLKKTITYEDFNGIERTEDFYFNLTEAELSEMDLDENGGLGEKLKKIVDSKDMKQIKDYFKSIMLTAYGEKSDDGKRFQKSEEISKAFLETQAYSDLWMTLCTDDKAASEFINSILPKKISQAVEKENAKSLSDK